VPESLSTIWYIGNNMIVTKVELKKARTDRGGFTNKQMKMAQKWYPGVKRWAMNLVGKEIPDNSWKLFIDARLITYKVVKSTVINPMSRPDGWDWKPQKGDIPTVKIKSKKNKNKGKKKKRRQKIGKQDDKDFYASREWRELRVRILEWHECKCMMCGESPRVHGIIIHVDHIKPRSKYPELSLVFNNLQLLCEACNLGKSNKYETDWRPNTEEDLDLKHLESIGSFV